MKIKTINVKEVIDMKTLRHTLITLLVFSLLGIFSAQISAVSAPKGKKKKKSERQLIKELPYNHRLWLTKDVVYIITDWEKQVFLKLENDRERDMFVTAFWKNRDPNPYTEENEYKEEHYRRMQYAEKRFQKGTTTPYWKTARGRMYIMLGEPHSVERYESESMLRPIIIWFYQGLVKYGLPNAFYVVFFQEDGSGDYVLYSPIKHGPHKLLTYYEGDPHDIESAYREILQIVPNVAKVSMSLIEGDYLPGARPTMRSEILLGKQIVEAPKKQVNDEYAKKLLKYKNYINVEYSVNYIANASKVKRIKDPNTGFYFIHYLVEPQKLSLEQYEGSYYSNLEVNGSVFNDKNVGVYEFSKNVPIRLSSDQLSKVQARLFSYQDFFPLMPGKYRLEILIRNTTSKEFTSVERELNIPETSEPGVDSILVANNAKKNNSVHDGDKPFFLNETQLLASPRDDFTAMDTLYLFFQVNGLTDQQKKDGYFVYHILKDDGNEKPLKTEKKSIIDYESVGGINYLERFSLKGLSATYYIIRISVYDGSGKFLYQGESNFYITPIAQLNRPWVISSTTPATGPEHYNTMAIQYAKVKDYDKALKYLEQAYLRAPSSSKLALNYCQVLFKAKKYRKVKAVATPFLQGKDKNEFFSVIGYASASLGEYDEAITHFKSYLAYHGTNIKILNAIGECYQKLNNIDEAMVAWEKSLELLPEQPKLKAHMEGLKKKKAVKSQEAREE